MLRRLLSYSVGLYAMAMLAGLARIGLRSLIAKTAGKEALGAYAFYGTAIALGGSLVAFGLKRSVAKLVAASGEERDYAPVVCAVMALFAVVTLAAAAIGLALSPWLDWVYLFALVALGPVTIFELARAAFRGQLDQRREVGLLFAGICVQALCVAGATVFSGNPRAPVWGATAANLLLALAVVGYFLRRHGAAWRPAALNASFRTTAFRGLLALSLPIWIADVFGVVGHQADQVIVQGTLGYAALAEYAAAFTFIGLLDQPITILSRVMLVTFAGGHYTEVEQYRTVTSLSLAFFSLLGLVTMTVAMPLTPVVFTAAYAAVPTLVAILSVSSIFNAVEVLNSSLTIARDYAEANRNASLWSTAVYIPLAFLLVHQGGVVERPGATSPPGRRIQ